MQAINLVPVLVKVTYFKISNSCWSFGSATGFIYCMMSKHIFTCCLFLWISFGALSQGLVFKGGHSHNDYHQKRPLFEALEHGMASIEADVFLRDGQLLVGHSEDELQADKTLENIYLAPLLKIVEAKSTSFKPIILLVDFKDRGSDTYLKLKEVLSNYKSMLTEKKDRELIQREITVIISGDRPIEQLRAEKTRFAFIDGRLNRDDIQDKADLIPLVSDDWTSYFSWNGAGDFPESDFQKLKQLVDDCHQHGKLVRFWGIPDEASACIKIWDIMLLANVDLLGCDCPACLEEYLNQKK